MVASMRVDKLDDKIQYFIHAQNKQQQSVLILILARIRPVTGQNSHCPTVYHWITITDTATINYQKLTD